MNKDEKVVLISISLIATHPKQEEIYGSDKIEKDFVESIAERGILQPLILADTDVFAEEGIDINKTASYVLVSGHRRLEGAKKAGLVEVPCVIREYKNVLETEYDLIVTNKHRNKTPSQIIKEVNFYKNLLSVYTESKRASGLQGTNKNNSKQFSENSENGEINGLPLEIRERLEAMEEKDIDTSEIIAEQLGISRAQVQQLIRVFNAEFQDKRLTKLYEADVDDETIKSFMHEWQAVRDECESGEISLDAAYKEVGKIIKEYVPATEKKKSAPVKKAVEKKKKYYVVASGFQNGLFDTPLATKPISNNSDTAIWADPYSDSSSEEFLATLKIIKEADYICVSKSIGSEVLNAQESTNFRTISSIQICVAGLLGKKVLEID